MTYVNKKRPYDKEYAQYQGTPEQIRNRTKRNKARAEMMKKGKVRKGDGMDVDHTVPISKGGGNSSSNLRVRTDNENRSFSRNSDRSVKRNSPKKK